MMSKNRILPFFVTVFLVIIFVSLFVSCSSPEEEDLLEASDIFFKRYHSFITTASPSIYEKNVNLFGITENGDMEPIHFYTKRGKEYAVASFQIVDGRYIALLVVPKGMNADAMSFSNDVRQIYTKFFLIDSITGTVLDVSSVIDNHFTTSCFVCKTNDEFIFQTGDLAANTYFGYNLSDSSVRQINNAELDGSFEDYAVSCDGHLLIAGYQWNELRSWYYPNTGEAPTTYKNAELAVGLRYHKTSFVGSGSADFLFDAEKKVKYVFTADGIKEEQYEYEDSLVGRYIHYYIPISSNQVTFYSAMEGRTVNYIEKSNEIVTVDISEGSIDIHRYTLPPETVLSEKDSALILGLHLVVKSQSNLYQIDLETGNRTVISSQTVNYWNTFDPNHLIITETNENNQTESYLWNIETQQKTPMKLFQESINGCFFLEGVQQ